MSIDLRSEPMARVYGATDQPVAARLGVLRVTSRLNVGGIAQHVTWLTEGLPAYDTTLVSGTLPPGEDCMLAFVRDHDIEPLLIPELGREIGLKDVISIWKLYRLMVRLQPRLVHSHAAKAGAAARLAGLLYRWLTPAALWGRPRPCRFVHTFHGHVLHSYFGPWKSSSFVWIEKLLARLATDRIIVISRQQYQEIHETFGIGKPGQVCVIPLGIDLDRFRGGPDRRLLLRNELGIGESELLVGIVGRLTEIKNHEMFLQVAARLRESARPVRFVVIGDGHLRPTLEEQASRLGLGRQVVFLGNRTDPENFYPALDVLALTSRNEGTPLTVIEAMANGRPVIATAAGGVVDLVGPVQCAETGYSRCERGILVPCGDVAGFCQGLERLLIDPSLRDQLGQAGQRFVQAHYHKDRLLGDMAQLYEELLPAPAESPDPSTGTGGDSCAS